MLEGENIVSAARKAIVRHDFSAVLAIFPILRHLKQTKPEFDQVLQVRGWRGAGDVRRRGPWGRGRGQLEGRGARRSAPSGNGRQHQEQAAQPDHLHGDGGRQGAGGLR